MASSSIGRKCLHLIFLLAVFGLCLMQDWGVGGGWGLSLASAQEAAVSAETSTDEQLVAEGEDLDLSEAAAAPAAERERTVFEQLLGDSLYAWGTAEADEQGNPQVAVYELDTYSLLKDKKYIALYFSASWCPPCRQFTPMLVKFYQSLAKKNKGLEVIWISGDRSQEEFLGYYQKMPWLAVPMEKAQQAMQRLGGPLGLKGIPHLVLIDAQGNVLTTDARTAVMKDQHGLQFPWQGANLSKLVPGPLKQAIARRIAEAKAAVKRFLRGILQGWMPRPLLEALLR